MPPSTATHELARKGGNKNLPSDSCTLTKHTPTRYQKVKLARHDTTPRRGKERTNNTKTYQIFTLSLAASRHLSRHHHTQFTATRYVAHNTSQFIHTTNAISKSSHRSSPLASAVVSPNQLPHRSRLALPAPSTQLPAKP